MSYTETRKEFGGRRKGKKMDRKKRKIRKRKEKMRGGSSVFLLVSNVQTSKRFDGREVSWTALQEVGVLSYSG